MIKKYSNFPISCKALLIERDKKKNSYSSDIKKIYFTNIKKNELLIKVNYSSLNFKDLMVVNGNPGLVRNYPHVPGIDAAGIVIKSYNNKFKIGDKVVVVGKPFGIMTNGGFSEIIKAPVKWVEKTPGNISLKKAMIFGTAGFTALLAVLNILKKKSKNLKKPVLISGASGGVGTVSIVALSILGFNVWACTSNKKNTEFLKQLGASKVIQLKEFKKKHNMPLLNKKFSAIVDNIGGDVFSYGLKELDQNGEFFSIGNISGENINLNILPFILRGVKVTGINTENISSKDRKKIWKLISIIEKKKKIKKIYKVYKFKNIKKILNKAHSNKIKGRVVIKIN